MPQIVNVNFKLDSDVKKAMESACSEMGLTMSAAFTIFAKKVSREKRIPFEITAYPEHNSMTYAEMKSDENGVKEHSPIDKDKIIEGLNTPIDECVSEEKVKF